MAEQWDGVLSVIQEEDPKSFSDSLHKPVMKLGYGPELNMRPGPYRGIITVNKKKEEREVSLSRRAHELRAERSHLLLNCYMQEVRAMVKDPRKMRQELATMTPERRKVFGHEAGIGPSPPKEKKRH